MAAAVQVQINGLEELKKAVRTFPTYTRPLLARAINASIAELDREAVDKNFQFKTPRGQRTGFLQRSFAFGIEKATDSTLRGAIGPTVKYAPYVHEGTSRGITPNRFMPRIAEAAERRIQSHFDKALDKIVKELATI